MVENVLANRYAKALVGAGTEAGVTDRLAEELALLVDGLFADGAMEKFWANDIIDRAVKRAALDEIISGAEPSDIMTRLLHLLLKKNRLTLLPRIRERFEGIRRSYSRTEIAIVRTARPLTEEMRGRLRSALARRFDLASVVIEEEVEEPLLGGIVVRLGCEVLDGSVKGALTRFLSSAAAPAAAGPDLQSNHGD